MIDSEQVEIDGKSFVKKYSKEGFYIERDGEKYSEAQDPEEFGRQYTETNEPIDTNGEQTEIEQKAEAFDYLTGGWHPNEQSVS